MDVASKLIELCSLHSSLDVRCQMSGEHTIDHLRSAPGEAVFHMILSGKCLITMTGAAPFLAKEGDLIIFPKGAAHRLTSISSNIDGRDLMSRTQGLFAPAWINAEPCVELDLLCGRIEYDIIAASLLFDSLPNVLHAVPENTRPELCAIMRLIRYEAEARRAEAEEVVTALMSALFVIALRQYLDTPQLDAGMLSLLADKSLSKSLVCMFKEAERNWTVETLAFEVNMSRSTFARHFRQISGKGPAEMLLAIRCHLARNLLQTTNLSTGEIASRLGYQSEAAFGKAYTRYMNASPSATRRGLA